MSLTRRAGLLLLCAGAYVGWLAASHFTLALNDEGIYLDGGLRVLHGQTPFKDFFALTGPGTFLLEAASMRVFGATLAAARLPVVFDIAILTACVFWLAARLSNQGTAAIASFTFLAFATLGETAAAANHRWDSSAWAVLSAALAVAAATSARRTPAFVAGIAAGIAAWCTPPVALATVAISAGLIAYRETRRLVPAYAGGVALALVAGTVWIATRGALPAMLDSLLWSAANYAGANRVWYGSVTGGYANLLHGGTAAGAAMTIALLVFLTLPATLPFFSAMWLWKRPPMTVVLLWSLGLALIASTYPRWDLNHLTWISAPFYALAAALIAQARFRKAIGAIALIAAASCFMVNVQQRLHETARVTSVGTLHGSAADLDILETIQTRVGPSETLFVFPYRPMLYFVTGAQNPTRYSFLQPGMFSDRDQSEALRELRAHPPQWVFYTYVAPEAYLRIWPGSDPRRLKMSGIEDFLKENYRGAGQWADFQLLAHTGARSPAQTALR